MGVQTTQNNTTQPFILSGLPLVQDDQTISQVAGATAGSVADTTTYPVADQDGLTEVVSVDGGAEQTVTFSGATTTAAGVAAQMNAQLTGCSVSVVGGQVVIVSDSVGVSSSIAIGTGTGALAWDTPVDGTGGEGLVNKTVVAQVPGTEEWVALTDVTATDGTQFPTGIYMGPDITAADLEAGDVEDAQILVSGVSFDEDQVVFQGSVGFSSVVTTADLTVRMSMIKGGLAPEKTTNISDHWG